MAAHLIFIKAALSEINVALDFFKSASISLREKKISQWNYWDNPPEDKIAWVKEGFEKGEFYFVQDENNNRIAMFRLLKNDTLYWEAKGTEAKTRYVHSLVVSLVHSGRGIGKMVLNQIIVELKSAGIEKFRLDCDASNKKLCQYYEGFGFRKTGTKKMKYSTNNLYEMDFLHDLT